MDEFKFHTTQKISSVNVTESAVFTFTEEILNGKLHFLQYQLSTTKHNYTFFYQLQNQVHAFRKDPVFSSVNKKLFSRLHHMLEKSTIST